MRHLFAIVVVLSLACTALAGAGRRTAVVDADAPIADEQRGRLRGIAVCINGTTEGAEPHPR